MKIRMFTPLLLVAIATLSFACGMVENLTKDIEESQVAAEKLIPILTNNCDSIDIEKVLSPELFEKKLTKTVMEYCEFNNEKLGLFKSIKMTNNSVNIPMGEDSSPHPIATYTANAIYEKGRAKIKLKLIKHDTTWQALSLKVNLEDASF